MPFILRTGSQMCTRSMCKVYPGFFLEKEVNFHEVSENKLQCMQRTLQTVRSRKWQVRTVNESASSDHMTTAPHLQGWGSPETTVQISLAQTFHITNAVQTPTSLTSSPDPPGNFTSPQSPLKSQEMTPKWTPGGTKGCSAISACSDSPRRTLEQLVTQSFVVIK